MQAIEILEREHHLILRALQVATGMRAVIEAGSPVEEEDLADLLDFFEVFADRTHRRKEEFLLIPWLKNQGVPVDFTAIHDPKGEHDHYRRQLPGLLPLLSQEPHTLPRIASLLRVMDREIRDHVEIEGVLLKRVSRDYPRDDQELVDAFREAIPHSAGLAAHYTQVVERLESRYLATEIEACQEALS